MNNLQMSQQPHSTFSYSLHCRRGVALLLVLAVLVITIPIAVVVAHQAGTNRLSYSTLQSTQLADDLRAAYEDDFVHVWLLEESANVALPPDSRSSALGILDEHWRMRNEYSNDEVHCRIQITAFDQAGMVPMVSARPGSPLRLALPSEILAQFEQLDSSTLNDDELKYVGLDTFSSADSSNIASSSSPFPTHDLARRINSVGSYLATTYSDMTTININTAPLPLLESALRSGGRVGGITAIINARAQNKLASLNKLNRQSRNNNTGIGHQINFVSSSTNWAFRIDVEAAGITRAWWCVYQLQPSSNQQNMNPWKCVQRLAINH